MIRADFQKRDGLYTGFSVTGHAGYAHAGKDIVCAGVSSAVMLSLNLLASFSVPGKPEITENRIVYTTDSNERAGQLLLDGLAEHLQALSEAYPEHICVTSGGKRK